MFSYWVQFKVAPVHFIINKMISLSLIETPPPGYISEDGETSDQQMNQSMDTGEYLFSSRVYW